ncbi:MAG: putative toxin-antitoxin system toxin component, PIN family [Chitinispirillaceae bacterium]|nr:putative toxin-antitoxin system toxin component, PIN family [Chitinispirillaceae bacterium]
MELQCVVIDTNVIVAALRSRQGASHDLFRLIGTGRFQLNLSVSLLIEYERALLDPKLKIPFSADEKRKILNYVCANAHHQEIYFLWRPLLADPGDDMILELAVASGSQVIVTFNKRDFRGVERFGIAVKAPIDYLKMLGELP